MDYKKLLDEIILSENVVDNFYDKYNNDFEFKNWLDSFIPEVKLCEEQKQNNPWHKYNVLGHILHSVQAMNSMTKDFDDRLKRILAYTMFLHDIGKPEAHIERIKDGQKIDSFFNHNIVSERIARDFLPKMDFNDSEVEIISKLVNKHDIFMFICLQDDGNKFHRVLNQDLINREIEDLNSIGNGREWLKYLVMVGRSDSLAQNEKMTAGALNLLERFDEMLDMENVSEK